MRAVLAQQFDEWSWKPDDSTTGPGLCHGDHRMQVAPSRPDGLWLGVSPMDRRLRAGEGGLGTGASHPRWPQIVSAAPHGVNPAARPIPPGADVEEQGASHELVR